jgi:hypothetical protein
MFMWKILLPEISSFLFQLPRIGCISPTGNTTEVYFGQVRKVVEWDRTYSRDISLCNSDRHKGTQILSRFLGDATVWMELYWGLTTSRNPLVFLAVWIKPVRLVSKLRKLHVRCSLRRLYTTPRLQDVCILCPREQWHCAVLCACRAFPRTAFDLESYHR